MVDIHQRLTPHFELGEYLYTDRAQFRDANRDVTSEQIEKLRKLAELEERVRSAIGGGPLRNHSGYRCPELNHFIGSTDRSQHPKCEAVDFSHWGFDYTPWMLELDFRTIIAAAKSGQLEFGQLIKETAIRYYKTGTVTSMWLHISLGAPWRPAERCGQCLEMTHGIYTMVDIVT